MTIRNKDRSCRLTSRLFRGPYSRLIEEMLLFQVGLINWHCCYLDLFTQVWNALTKLEVGLAMIVNGALGDCLLFSGLGGSTQSFEQLGSILDKTVPYKLGK